MSWRPRACATLAAVTLSAWSHAGMAAEAAPSNVAGALVGVESTPVAGVYYARRGSGLFQPIAATQLGFTSALLTGLGGGRLRLERDEVCLRSKHHALHAFIGTGYAFASDTGGTYRAWQALLGTRATYETGRWELGLSLAYLPVLLTHVRFSPAERDTFADRYPDARDERGPRSADVWLAGQRVEAALTSRVALGEWSLDGALGVMLSPGAGRNWANLELGQLPLVLRLGVARGF
jgi:hypothetical protein